MADANIGRRCEVYWPEEDKWFEGVITEKGQDKESAPGVYNNVGWRVEYDDGDIGWVKDLEDAALVRMLDDAGPSADAPPLMAAVATSVDAHAHGEKGDIQANADALVDPPSGAVSFSQEPTVQLPAAGDGEPELVEGEGAVAAFYFTMAEPERYRKFATMEAAFKARLRGDRELMCIFWGRWREIMRVWNYMLVMRHDVKRRTFLLDEIREKYLKDVMAVKAALAHAAKNGGKPGAVHAAATDPSTSALDMRGWGDVPKQHSKQFDELEAKGYLALTGLGDEREKKRPGYEILEEKTVPLYAPKECAFLSYHCERCQGVLALVYSRNHRVTAALGLVSTWEDFKAETAEELARIPQLEKQAKTLREQLNNTNGVLTETEIKVGELQEQLNESNNKYRVDTAALESEKAALEKIANRVPELEAQLSNTESKLEASETLCEERAQDIASKAETIANLERQLAEEQADKKHQMAVRDLEIAAQKQLVTEANERGMMALEEIWQEKRETVPTLKNTVGRLEDALDEATARASFAEASAADLKLKLEVTTKRADKLQQDLTETRADLAVAMTPPEVKDFECQFSPVTKETDTQHVWVEHKEPTEPFKVIAVSNTVVSFCEAPEAVTAKQSWVNLGADCGTQMTVETADASEACVLKTEAETKLEAELEDALDRLESTEDALAALEKEHAANLTKLKLAEADCEDAIVERDDAQALCDEIEEQTAERVNSGWKAKYKMQGIIGRLMLNSQQAMTAKLAGMINGMKAKVTVQAAFMGALAKGRTKIAVAAERAKHVSDDHDDHDEHADDGGEDLELGGRAGETSNLENDANALERFKAVLEERIEVLTAKSQEADREIAQLRFLFKLKTKELRTKSTESLKFKNKLHETEDQLAAEKVMTEELRKQLAAKEAESSAMEADLKAVTSARDAALQLASDRWALIEAGLAREAKLQADLDAQTSAYNALAAQRLQELKKLHKAVEDRDAQIVDLTEERNHMMGDKKLLQKAIEDSYRTHCAEVRKLYLDNLKPTKSVGTQLDCCVCAMRPNAVAAAGSGSWMSGSSFVGEAGNGNNNSSSAGLIAQSKQQQQASQSFIMPKLSHGSGNNNSGNSGFAGSKGLPRGSFRPLMVDSAAGRNSNYNASANDGSVTIVVDRTGQRYPFGSTGNAGSSAAARPQIQLAARMDHDAGSVALPQGTILGDARAQARLVASSAPRAPPHMNSFAPAGRPWVPPLPSEIAARAKAANNDPSAAAAAAKRRKGHSSVQELPGGKASVAEWAAALLGPEDALDNAGPDDEAQWSIEEEKLLALQLHIEQRRAQHYSQSGSLPPPHNNGNSSSQLGSLHGSQINSQAGSQAESQSSSRPATPGQPASDVPLEQASSSAKPAYLSNLDLAAVDPLGSSKNGTPIRTPSGALSPSGGLNDDLTLEPPFGFEGFGSLLSPPPPSRDQNSKHVTRGMLNDLSQDLPSEAAAVADNQMPPL